MPRIPPDQLPPTATRRRVKPETRPAQQLPASPHQRHGDRENPDTADDLQYRVNDALFSYERPRILGGLQPPVDHFRLAFAVG